MKLALATPTPEVKTTVPVALLSGSFPERMQKAARLGYDGVELMVVDNGSHDDSVARITAAFPHVHMYAIKENCGFAQGTNLGIMEAKRAFDPDYFFLLSNDTTGGREH